VSGGNVVGVDIRTAYAVVKRNGGKKEFSKWHNSYDEAEKEAIRLCKKEGEWFFVMKVLGQVSLLPPEVKVERYNW
jgi:hypothetical protein